MFHRSDTSDWNQNPWLIYDIGLALYHSQNFFAPLWIGGVHQSESRTKLPEQPTSKFFEHVLTLIGHFVPLKTEKPQFRTFRLNLVKVIVQAQVLNMFVECAGAQALMAPTVVKTRW
jgi:hypothetical protein